MAKKDVSEESIKLVWDLQEKPDDWATAKTVSWETQCGGYRVTRVDPNDKTPVYFGACHWYEPNSDNAKPYWNSIEAAKEGPGYPKKYSTLEAAVEVAEFHFRKTTPVDAEIVTNRDELLAYASQKKLSDRTRLDSPSDNDKIVDARPKNDVQVRSAIVRVLLSKAQSLLISLGFKNAKDWSISKITKRLNDPDIVGSASRTNPDGEDLQTFRIITKALEQGQEMVVVDEAVAVAPAEEEKPVKTPKVKASKVKAEPSTNGKPKKRRAKPSESILRETKFGPVTSEKVPKVKGRPKGSPNAKRQGMSGLDAAVKILVENKKPLKAKEIVELASSKGYWTSPGGKTPWNTIEAQMNTEIKKRGKESRFAKPGPGLFTIVRAGKK